MKKINIDDLQIRANNVLANLSLTKETVNGFSGRKAGVLNHVRQFDFKDGNLLVPIEEDANGNKATMGPATTSKDTTIKAATMEQKRVYTHITVSRLLLAQEGFDFEDHFKRVAPVRIDEEIEYQMFYAGSQNGTEADKLQNAIANGLYATHIVTPTAAGTGKVTLKKADMRAVLAKFAEKNQVSNDMYWVANANVLIDVKNDGDANSALTDDNLPEGAFTKVLEKPLFNFKSGFPTSIPGVAGHKPLGILMNKNAYGIARTQPVLESVTSGKTDFLFVVSSYVDGKVLANNGAVVILAPTASF